MAGLSDFFRTFRGAGGAESLTNFLKDIRYKRMIQDLAGSYLQKRGQIRGEDRGGPYRDIVPRTTTQAPTFTEPTAPGGLETLQTTPTPTTLAPITQQFDPRKANEMVRDWVGEQLGEPDIDLGALQRYANLLLSDVKGRTPEEVAREYLDVTLKPGEVAYGGFEGDILKEIARGLPLEKKEEEIKPEWDYIGTKKEYYAGNMQDVDTYAKPRPGVTPRGSYEEFPKDYITKKEKSSVKGISDFFGDGDKDTQQKRLDLAKDIEELNKEWGRYQSLTQQGISQIGKEPEEFRTVGEIQGKRIKGKEQLEELRKRSFQSIKAKTEGMITRTDATYPGYKDIIDDLFGIIGKDKTQIDAVVERELSNSGLLPADESFLKNITKEILRKRIF
jgi:hypothetical protein